MERKMLGWESNYGSRNNYWYDKEKGDPEEERRGRRRDGGQNDGGRELKNNVSSLPPPSIHPFPPSAFLPSGICPFLSPLLLLSPSSFSFFSPPPSLSMLMALYHSATLSLSLSPSVGVQSCGRSETCIVESARVWVYRKTRLRRTMRELLELFYIVSMGACVFVFVCGPLFCLYQGIRGHECQSLWTCVHCYSLKSAYVKICCFGHQKSLEL